MLMRLFARGFVSCAGLGERIVDDSTPRVVARVYGLGVLVEVPHEGVEAGEGDAECRGQMIGKSRLSFARRR